MPNLAAQVMADRVARDAAKVQFEGHYHAFKADLASRGLGGRIADEAMEQAQAVFDEAIAVVEEHPAAVGGTLVAIVIWFVRDPLMRLVHDLVNRASK